MTKGMLPHPREIVRKMRAKGIDDDVLISIYKRNLKRFKKGDCEECEKKNTDLKYMAGWSSEPQPDGQPVGEVWVCIDCYKEKMRKFPDHNSKYGFYPQYVFDGLRGKWMTVVSRGKNKITGIETFEVTECL